MELHEREGTKGNGIHPDPGGKRPDTHWGPLNSPQVKRCTILLQKRLIGMSGW
jgi:hypothetical protein